MTLLERIEIYLTDNAISATTFGRAAVGDPRFVLDLRAGRMPRKRTIRRLEDYLSEHEAERRPDRDEGANASGSRDPQPARSARQPDATIARRHARPNSLGQQCALR